MLDTFGPSVFRNCPCTIRLDCNVVDTAANTEETVLTPMGSPRVTDSPVLLAIISDTPADN